MPAFLYGKRTCRPLTKGSSRGSRVGRSKAERNSCGGLGRSGGARGANDGEVVSGSESRGERAFVAGSAEPLARAAGKPLGEDDAGARDGHATAGRSGIHRARRARSGCLAPGSSPERRRPSLADAVSEIVMRRQMLDEAPNRSALSPRRRAIAMTIHGLPDRKRTRPALRGAGRRRRCAAGRGQQLYPDGGSRERAAELCASR